MFEPCPMISLKRRLRAGGRLTGCWSSLCSPMAAEIMARTGYDITMIDLEHGPGSHLDAISLMHAVTAGGGCPVIRSSSSGAVDIKRALDSGPAGIMIPDVRNGEHAREVVARCHYPPDGVRGAAPGFIRATGFDPGSDVVSRYRRFMAEDFLLIAQVESMEALEDIDAIAGTEGIDMLFVGPVDLSASIGSLGVFDSREFTDAMERIVSATLAAGKYLGSIRFADYTPYRLYQAGFDLVIAGADTILLTQAAQDDLQQLSAELED